MENQIEDRKDLGQVDNKNRLNAQEARFKTLKSDAFEKELDNIFNIINTATEKGKLSVSIPLRNEHAGYLRKLGYDVMKIPSRFFGHKNMCLVEWC